MKIENLEKYIKVSADESLYLTSYKDGNDILEFSSSVIMFAPLGTDLSNLREITEDENNYYSELQLIKLKELEDGKNEQ